jgi:hypothetical protein
MIRDYWGDTSVDVDNKKNELNKMSREELLEFFVSAPICYLELLSNDKIDTIIGEPIIIERIISAIPKWQVSSQTVNSILMHFNSSNFINFMNEYMIEQIQTSSKYLQIVQEIISCDNLKIGFVLGETPFLKYLVDNIDIYRSILEKMSEGSAVCLFNYIINHDPKLMKLISNLNREVQWAVISNIGLADFYKYLKKYDLFYDLEDSVKRVLIEKEPYYSYFVNLPIDDIVSYILSGLELPNNLSRSPILIQKLATIPDPNTYRLMIKRLESSIYEDFRYLQKREYQLALEYYKENDIPFNSDDIEFANKEVTGLPTLEYGSTFNIQKVELERKRYYDKLVNSLQFTDYMIPEYYYIKIGKIKKDKYWFIKNSSEEIKNKFKDGSITSDNIDSLLSELSSSRLLEILVDRYFEDITYNFLINVDNLLNFYNSIDLDILGLDKEQLVSLKERIGIYSKIHSFYDLNSIEQVELYNSFDKSKDYATLFYEDYSLARNVAYTSMNDKAFSPDKRKDLYNKELSSKYGVDIYEAKGEEFYAYIHVTDIDRKEKIVSSIWRDVLEDYINNPRDNTNTKSGASLSFISGKKLEAGPDGRKVNTHVTLGFNYLVPERIAHISYGDSGSDYYRRGVGTSRVSEVMMADTLIDHTRNYNEILYQEFSPIVFDTDVKKKYEKLKPDFLVCYDEILDEDIKLAKKYKLPIFLIKTMEYSSSKDDYNYHNDDRVYLDLPHQLEQITTYRRK